MKRINIIGERAIYWFKDAQGNEVSEFSTDIDYNERFIEQKKGNPMRTGCVFIRAKRATLFDTPDGFIHEGEYAPCVENGEKKILTVLDGRFLNLSATKVEEMQSLPDGEKAATYKGEVDVIKVKEIPKEDIK